MAFAVFGKAYEITSRLQHRLKLKLVAAVCLLACGLIWTFLSVRHEVYFRVAFHRSVTRILTDRTPSFVPEAAVEDACVAAQACTSHRGIQLVERQCVSALKEFNWPERFVASYVLLEGRDFLLDETRKSVKELAADPKSTEFQRREVQYLIDHFEEKSATSARNATHGPMAPNSSTD